MIRRDYILRMIEEFLQVLARINFLKKGQFLSSGQADAEGWVVQLWPCYFERGSL